MFAWHYLKKIRKKLFQEDQELGNDSEKLDGSVTVDPDDIFDWDDD